MSGQASKPASNSAPAMAGLAAAARLRGADVTLAAAGRSGGVTTAITYEERVGTSICDSAARTSSKARATSRLGATAARIRQTLDGICVNTIVFTSPMRRDSQAATGNENAARTPDQKKYTPAAASDKPNLLNSHNARRDCTAKPPANASTLNKA